MDTSKKISFFAGFWQALRYPIEYKLFLQSGWWHAIFHVFILLFILSASAVFSLFEPMKDLLEKNLSDLPGVEIADSTAHYEEGTTFPHVMKFSIGWPSLTPPFFEEKDIYYILDSGEHQATIEEKYEQYILYTDREIILNLQGETQKAKYSELESSQLVEHFFGEVEAETEEKYLLISGGNIAHFAASLVAFSMLICLPIGIPTPLPLMLGVFFALGASTLAGIAVIAVKNKKNLPFSQIYKLALFALTPTIVIQILSFIFWPSKIFMWLSWIVGGVYLIMAIKDID